MKGRILFFQCLLIILIFFPNCSWGVTQINFTQQCGCTERSLTNSGIN